MSAWGIGPFRTIYDRSPLDGHSAPVLLHSWIGNYFPHFKGKLYFYDIAVFPIPIERNVSRFVDHSRKYPAVDGYAGLFFNSVHVRIQTSGNRLIPGPTRNPQFDVLLDVFLRRYGNPRCSTPRHVARYR